MVNFLSSKQTIWVQFPLSAKLFAYLVKLVNTTDLKSVPIVGYRFKSDRE